RKITHTTQTLQKHSCGGCSRPLYSSHTTPHTTNHTPTQQRVFSMCFVMQAPGPTHIKWIAVPDTQQCTNAISRFKYCPRLCVSRICVSSPSWLPVCFHADSNVVA